MKGGGREIVGVKAPWKLNYRRIDTFRVLFVSIDPLFMMLLYRRMQRKVETEGGWGKVQVIEGKKLI